MPPGVNVKKPLKMGTVAVPGGAKAAIPAIKNNDATDSMEMTGIVLPSGNGVVAIGDLWNCRTNTVEGNLFDGRLKPEFLQADPVQTMNYSYHSCLNSRDVTDIMKVSAELKVDFTSGGTEIKVSGSGSYENTDKSTFRDDNIVVSHDVVTYQVRALPKAAEQISERMKFLLTEENEDGSKMVVATHFVQAILVGGKSTGFIKYRENTSDAKKEIKGEFNIEVKVGPVDIKAKASFEKLDEEYIKSYDTTVGVEAQPRFDKSPTTVAQMFKQVENLDHYVNRERHFPELDKIDENGTETPKYVMRVQGVPIEFKLVPIVNILPIEIDEKYKLLDAETLDNLLNMTCSLRDFTNPDYLKRQLMEREMKIIPILIDDYNPLTEEIQQEAIRRAKRALELKHASAKVFREYKTDEEKKNDIEALMETYNEEFAEIDLEQMYREYIRRGKQELADIRASDVDGLEDEEGQPTMNFFSNKVDMDDWFNREKTIKILLRTDQKDEGAPTGVFMKLYNLSHTLKKCGIEAGVAFPNISEGKFNLSFKTSEELTVYDRGQIKYFLEILSVAVDEGDTIPKLFYSLNAALSGLHLPMIDYLFDVPNLAIVMSEYRDTVICETYCELLAKLFETVSTWNLVFPIEGLNSSIEMMRFYRQLRLYLPEKYPALNFKFFVSRFNNVSTKYNAPLCLLFFENRFQAVCLDHVDILIMEEELGREEPDFQLLSYGRIRESCIYTPRADWAISVIQNLSLEHETYKTDPVLDSNLPEFDPNPDPYLRGAVEVTRSSAMREEPRILTSVALLALEDCKIEDELEALLSTYGWKDGEFDVDMWKIVDWSQFHTDLKNFIGAQAPFLLKVVLALEELQALGPKVEEDPDDVWDEERWTNEVDAIIKFIRTTAKLSGRAVSYQWKGRQIIEDEVYDELRRQVEAYDTMPGKVRKIGISKLFEKFIVAESSKDELFHIFNLMLLVEGMADPNFKSFKQLLLPMCKKYCDKVPIPEELYPRGRRRLDDYLTERQLFKALGVLGEVSFHANLYVVHQELFNFSGLPAPVNLKSLIEKLSNPLFDFDILQLQVIWSNPKFLRILRQVMDNEGVLDTLIVHVKRINDISAKFLKQLSLEETQPSLIYEEEDEDGQDVVEARRVGDLDEMPEFPWFMPPDIVEKVKILIVLRRKPVFDYPKVWSTVSFMVEAFQIIEAKSFMPFDFLKVLRQNVEDGGVAETALKEVGALVHWSETEKLFEHPWSWNHVQAYLKLLMEMNIKNTAPKEIVKTTPKLIPKTTNNNNEDPPLPVNDIWTQFVAGGALERLPYSKFSQLDHPLSSVIQIMYDRLGESVPSAIRYLSQHLLMGDTASLGQRHVERFIKYPPLGLRPGQIDFGDGVPGVGSLGHFLSRGDILTALLHLTDSVGAYHVLRSLMKSGVAIPLLITSIAPGPGPKQTIPTKAFFLDELLNDLWFQEMETFDLLLEPRLFRYPYRFVLTLRVGDTLEEKGRSSLINTHVMNSILFFGSKLDPGSVNGRPLNRIGFLEFSPLTESTTNPNLWTNFIAKDHQDGMINLLGVLHGDATTLPSLYEVILPLVSTIVVFWKVSNYNELKAKRAQLLKILDTPKRILDVVLYPDSSFIDKVDDRNLIFKESEGSGQADRNMNKIHNIVSEALQFSVIDAVTRASPPQEMVEQRSLFATLAAPKGSKPLSTQLPITVTRIGPVSTPESRALLEHIERTTIGDIQDAVGVKNSPIIDKLVDLFSKLLASNNADKGLTHATWELDRQSRKNGAEFYGRILKIREQIEKKTIDPMDILNDTFWVKETQEETRLSMALLRRHTLTIHDLWRITWNHSPIDLSGGHFLSFPMEMYHPSHSPLLWGNGIAEVLNTYVSPETKIFVVSAVGLKSSGKSTLLNSLFGSAFTEFGTTYGLQFRIVWLQPDLQEELDCNAFIVIDAEGLGAQENKLDQEADSQERAVLSMLLALSGVCLCTVTGRVLGELQDILELSMFSLSKLKTRALLQPADVFVVQNFLPGQPSDTIVTSQFASAVSGSVTITRKFELETGLRTTEAHRLKQIKSRNKHDEFHFKLGDRNMQELYAANVQILYARILKAAKVSRGVRTTFGDWFPLSVDVWEEIQSIRNSDVAGIFRSPTSGALSSNISLQDRIAATKKKIDAAYFYHEKKILGEYSVEIDTAFRDYVPNFDSVLEVEILTKILIALNKVINVCEDDVTNVFTLRRRQMRMKAAGEVNPNSCPACLEAFTARETLFAELSQLPGGFLRVEELTRYSNYVKDSVYERIRQGMIARQIAEQKSAGNADTLFGKLAAIEAEFPEREEQYVKFLQAVSLMQYIIPATYVCHSELKDAYASLPHVMAQLSPEPDEHRGEPLLDEALLTFDVSIYNSALESAMNIRKSELMTWLQHDWLVGRLKELPMLMFEDFEAVIYKSGMAEDLKVRVQGLLDLFQKYCGGEPLLPDFRWEAHLFAIKLFMKYILEQQEKWDMTNTGTEEDEEDPDAVVIKGNNPLRVLRAMENVFMAADPGDYFLPPNQPLWSNN